MSPKSSHKRSDGDHKWQNKTKRKNNIFSFEASFSKNISLKIDIRYCLGVSNYEIYVSGRVCIFKRGQCHDLLPT